MNLIFKLLYYGVLKKGYVEFIWQLKELLRAKSSRTADLEDQP